MAHQPSLEELDQALKGEITQVVSSALWHVGVLKASIDYLQTEDSLTPDLKLALSSLSVDEESISTPVDDGPVILPSPLSHTVLNDYVGTNAKHLVVQVGEEVMVYAWATQGEVAIAYSTKCDRVGWVPRVSLAQNPHHAGNEERPSIWVAKRKLRKPSESGSVEDDGYLTWDIGHYILACKIANKPMATLEGAGINLATGDFGEFYVSSTHLEKVRK